MVYGLRFRVLARTHSRNRPVRVIVRVMVRVMVRVYD